jgi:WD40 repeat protein
MTASGDKTVALFDTITARKVATFAGHRGSVKTCSPWDACPGVLASGARDGCVQVRPEMSYQSLQSLGTGSSEQHNQCQAGAAMAMGL